MSCTEGGPFCSFLHSVGLRMGVLVVKYADLLCMDVM